MSIEIDWELTDAPTADDAGSPPARTPSRTSPPSQPPPDQPPFGDEPGPRRAARRWWLAVPLVLLAVAAVGLSYMTRLGWQRVTDEVTALVRYEEQLSYQGETLLVLRVQDFSNSQWLSVRSGQVAARQPAPLPVPVLSPDPDSAQIGPLEMIDTDWVRAEVLRDYRTPDGQTVTFSLPQFYRRPGLGQDWVRTGVPDSYWGAWQDWQSPHLFVRHSERDAALVAAIGPRLEALLGETCLLWAEACVGLPRAKLFLSGYVGSLEYDPLANIRVRVEFGDPATGVELPADYFVSVPSPQLAGAPADAATEEYLTEYLAVRLIASLADQATHSSSEADALTAQAVQRLDLSSADPGFAAATTPPRGEAGVMFSFVSDPAEGEKEVPAEAPSVGATVVTRLQPPENVSLVTYEVQDGDSLWAIALNFGVPVETIARLNGIDNPDLIQVGSRLLIPVEPAQ